ncbi:MAG: hypothetical protein ACTHKQ_11290, partial [Mesorhizobium sp.]
MIKTEHDFLPALFIFFATASVPRHFNDTSVTMHGCIMSVENGANVNRTAKEQDGMASGAEKRTYSYSAALRYG